MTPDFGAMGPTQEQINAAIMDLLHQGYLAYFTKVNYDEALFQRLRAWRLERAQETKKPPYVIFSDATLKAIAAARSRNLEDLNSVKGAGPRKLEPYGQRVLDIVAGRD